MTRALLAWSSGKDSAHALHVLRQRGDVEVVALLTTFNATAGRVAMHAVRRELVHAQAAAVSLPLIEVEVPWPCPNGAYETAMAAAMDEAKARGVDAVAFGDLFLADVRRYREERLAPTGLQPPFPLRGLWDSPQFSAPLAIVAGEVVDREGFVFADVRPAAAVPA